MPWHGSAGLPSNRPAAATEAKPMDRPPVDLLPFALDYRAAGISLVPCSHLDKRPEPSLLPGGKWKPYQTAPPDEATVRSGFDRGCKAVAGIGGKVSGGLLIIDFDEARFYDAWQVRWASLADGLPSQRTGREGGGFQVWLRCPEPGRNDKLACVPMKRKSTGRRCAVETRAKAAMPGLPGSLHPSGRRYEAISGDFAAIPTVPQAVADALLNAARKLDEAPLTRKQMEAREKAAKTSDRHRAESNGQASVIDEYNSRVFIQDDLRHTATSNTATDGSGPAARVCLSS